MKKISMLLLSIVVTGILVRGSICFANEAIRVELNGEYINIDINGEVVE